MINKWTFILRASSVFLFHNTGGPGAQNHDYLLGRKLLYLPSLRITQENSSETWFTDFFRVSTEYLQKFYFELRISWFLKLLGLFLANEIREESKISQISIPKPDLLQKPRLTAAKSFTLNFISYSNNKLSMYQHIITFKVSNHSMLHMPASWWDIEINAISALTILSKMISHDIGIQ